MTLTRKNKYESPETTAVSLSCEQFLCQSTDFPGAGIEDVDITDLGWDDTVINVL